ncbi:enterotoxin SeN [Staphylococcus aureus]|uniref:toxin, OB-fold domain protein n=1 Tax=Staphylococcus aureus TaxID=1280 RepID=UPI0007699A78|nr:toxin, OB-fold domain protein [Staphylococcus aureus]CXW22294.1 enterotoxin SeN [Staphylococcus aureus]
MRLFYIAAIIITLLCLINNNYVNAEVDKKDLKKKSDLDSSKLFNLTSYYTDITWQLDESNKISTDQLLNNTIILKNIDISVLNNVKGSVGAEFFQFYSDNRTVSSSNYHIDVFLYKD